MNETEQAIKRVLDLCEFWDGLTKTESPTTLQIREAIGPVEIEKANNPSQTVDGSQLSFGFKEITWGDPHD